MARKLFGVRLLLAVISTAFWITLFPLPIEAEDGVRCSENELCSDQTGVTTRSVARRPNDDCAPCGHCSRCGGDRTIWVDQATGDDLNGGLTKDDAVKTIGRGAELVRGGDVMIVRPGIYYEQPVFKNLDSSASNPIWILSEKPGEAIISSLWPEAELGTERWTSIGDGIYAAEHGDAAMGEAMGHFLFRYKSLADLRAPSVIDINKPRYGFAHEDGWLYLRLPGDADPNGKTVRLTDQFKRTILSLKNAPYVIIDGFAMTGSGDAPAIVGDKKSHHLTLRNLIVTHSRRAARLPDHSLFEWSEYSYPGFYRFVDDLIDLNPDKATPIYNLVKRYFSHKGNAYLEGGIADSVGKPSEQVEFRFLYIHQVFDGQQLGAFNNSTSHHNVCAYVYDDCIEFEHWRPTFPATNLHVHDSLMLNATASALSHQDATGGMRGPHFVYRNVIYNTDYKHARPPYLVKNKNLRGDHKIIYYHNLLQNWKGPTHEWGTTNWIYWDNQDGKPENLTFRNNIFILDELTDRHHTPRPDSDYNILINISDNPDVRGDNGFYLGADASALGLADSSRLDFGLTSKSPAIDAGVSLPSDWPDSRRIEGLPDVGPFEFGERPGPDWPRPRRTTFTSDIPDRWAR